MELKSFLDYSTRKPTYLYLCIALFKGSSRHLVLDLFIRLWNSPFLLIPLSRMIKKQSIISAEPSIHFAS